MLVDHQEVRRFVTSVVRDCRYWIAGEYDCLERGACRIARLDELPQARVGSLLTVNATPARPDMEHMQIGIVPLRHRECPGERRLYTGGIVEWVENQRKIHGDDPLLEF
jgi:hypothetical protein